MKDNYYRDVLLYEIIGIFVIFVIGFVWHNLYEITGYNKIVGFIAPVNESPWEHWKIAIFPWFLYAFFEYPFIKYKINNFIFAKTLGLIVFELVTFGILFIHSKLTGSYNLALDIIMYFIGILVGQLISYLILTKTEINKFLNNISTMIIVVQVIIILIFTISPPRTDYFKDSTTGTFGIYEYTK